MLICQSCAMPFDPSPDTREIRTLADGVLHLIGVVCGCSPVGLTNAEWRQQVADQTVEGRMPSDDD